DRRPVARGSAALDYGVLPRDPTQLAQTLHERIIERIGGYGGTDPENLPSLLPLSGTRRGEEAAGHGTEERSTLHYSITWSARASSDGESIASEGSLPARVVSVEHVFNVIGAGYPDPHHRFFAGRGEMGHARRYHDAFPGPDRFELRGIPQFAPTD